MRDSSESYEKEVQREEKKHLQSERKVCPGLRNGSMRASYAKDLGLDSIWGSRCFKMRLHVHEIQKTFTGLNGDFAHDSVGQIVGNFPGV